jgi:hypothetical protein
MSLESPFIVLKSFCVVQGMFLMIWAQEDRRTAGRPDISSRDATLSSNKRRSRIVIPDTLLVLE